MGWHSYRVRLAKENGVDKYIPPYLQTISKLFEQHSLPVQEPGRMVNIDKTDSSGQMETVSGIPGPIVRRTGPGCTCVICLYPRSDK